MANKINNSLPKPEFFDSVKPKKRTREDEKITSLLIESPLSKEGLSERHKIRKLSDKSKHVFNIAAEFGTDLESLSKIYDMNFTTPPFQSNEHSFFALGTLMMQIECCLKDHFFSKNVDPVREKLENILLNKELTHEKKMAELGCLLYFLDRDRLLPSIDVSYVSYRADEICIEIEELIFKHIEMEEFDKERLIPSGKMHYLLRTFAKMIVTTNQKLNIGSLHALILILEDSTMDVVSHFKPEHHTHILCVLKQLITNPSFRTLIEKEILVHPNLASLICIDLKIAKMSEIPSVAVMWDCIMALLFDIRQQNEFGNCFAVSALIYAIENSTYKVLVYMIEALTKGHFAFNDTLSIPILPLVEKKLVYEKDLTTIKMPSSQALELTTFQNISTILNLSSSSIDSEEGSLHNTLRELMEENKAEEKLPYAQKLLHTYKHNAIIHMLLGLIEFQHINSSTTPSLTSPFSKYKQSFLNTLFSLLPSDAKETYTRKFKQKLEEQFWLKDCIEIHVSKEITGEIKYGPSYDQKTIKNFEGNVDSLCQLLKNGRRVYFLENGKYEAIETLSALKKILIDTANAVNKESGKKYNLSTSKTVKLLEQESAKSIIANYCVSQIKFEKIEGFTRENLMKSDLLLLAETGGVGQICLSRTFGLKYSTFNFAANDTRGFLEKYHDTLKKLDEKDDRTFLVHSKNHSFTLSLKESLIPFQNSNSFGSWIKRKIYSRATNLLKKSMPQNEPKALMESFISKHPEAKTALSPLSFNSSSDTYKTFYDLVLQKLPTPQLRLNFARFFDTDIMKLKFDGNLLQDLLEKLKIKIEKKPFDKLLKTIEIRIKEPTPPFIMAREIRKALIDSKLKILSPILIEQCICDLFSLPCPVDIGDFNYYDSHREDPIHARLVVRHHFGSQELLFLLRNKFTEDEENFVDYKNLQIFHPSI